ISKMRVIPSNIGIEITESVFESDYEKINRILGRLKKAGFIIAIDDFGTGYSSLARERELNINCLKIDQSFIDKLMYLEPEKTITDDIISMAHNLGHYVIAEGVELEKQKQYLQRHGCDKIQGYLISKPLDEDIAIEFLRKYKSIENQ
ncbi:MAG: EAL domain-containing protein, partial [Candidatus Caldatribacteriota bacterium]